MMLQLPDTPVFRAVRQAAEKLRHEGFETRIVGGAVRDMLLGESPHDFDLVSTAQPEEVRKIFPDCQLVGASFGVTLIQQNGFTMELATARAERSYMDGRHPERVIYTQDFALDAERRDFSINAMSFDPLSCRLYDTVHGADDLARGIVCAVGEPVRRFQEDYLRMLRAVRFAARLNFELESRTRKAIVELAPLAAQLSGERIREELTRMLTSPHPERAMKLLLETGLLQAVLPEAAALAGVEQPPEFHPEGDVFTHTMLMLRHMALANANLAWSVLLHDVGKPQTRKVGPDGRARFFDHESRGAEMAEEICRRLHFSCGDAATITHAVRNHMRFASVPQMREAKLRKLLAEPDFPLELELHRLDCLCCHGKMECYLLLLDRLAVEPELRELPEPWVRGRDLVAAGAIPGPKFKTVLDELFEGQLAGEFSSPQEALKAALARLEN